MRRATTGSLNVGFSVQRGVNVSVPAGSRLAFAEAGELATLGSKMARRPSKTVPTNSTFTFNSTRTAARLWFRDELGPTVITPRSQANETATSTQVGVQPHGLGTFPLLPIATAAITATAKTAARQMDERASDSGVEARNGSSAVEMKDDSASPTNAIVPRALWPVTLLGPKANMANAAPYKRSLRIIIGS
jgi:hypothetical protein